MASISFAYSVVIFLIASLSFSCVHLSYGVPALDLATICKQTTNLTKCLDILESDPGTASADLPKLSLISIGLTKRHVVSNLKSYTDFSQNATAPEQKKMFVQCVGIYNGIEANVQEAYELSQKGNYKDSSKLDQAKKSAQDCKSFTDMINSLALKDLSLDQIFLIDVSLSVNKYIVTHVNQ